MIDVPSSAEIRSLIAAAPYQVRQVDSGFESMNPNHRLAIRHDAGGRTAIRSLGTNNPKASVSLKLKSLSRGKTIATYERPLSTEFESNKVAHTWAPGFSEQWINSESGPEQIFILKERLVDVQSETPMKLDLDIETSLQASAGRSGVVFKSHDGVAELHYRKLVAWDATGKHLDASMQLNGKSVVLEIWDNQAAYPITIDPVFQQNDYIKPTVIAANDNFGFSVAISGNTMVVGAPGYDIEIPGNPDPILLPSCGAAYVFVFNGTGWVQQAILQASNFGGLDNFGKSVAIYNNTIAVGAPNEDSDPTAPDFPNNQSSLESGAVYVFERTVGSTEWLQTALLKASVQEIEFQGGSGDAFGASVAISGQTLAVGAIGEDSNSVEEPADNSAPNSGAVYVYNLSDINEAPRYVKAAAPGIDDTFGASLALEASGSNARLVVGSPFRDSPRPSPCDPVSASESNSGAIYVFSIALNPPAIAPSPILTAACPKAQDNFGVSVGVSGNTVIAGAESRDAGAIDSGAAYVFTLAPGNTWIQEAELTRGVNALQGDRFGSSVAIAGDLAVVGGYLARPAANSVASGAAFAFGRSLGAWSPIETVVASNAGSDDSFGASIAMYRDKLVVGAELEDSSSRVSPNDSASNAGAAYSYLMTQAIGDALFKDGFENEFQ